MTTIRQDAWSTDEDLLLAEVVLRHIREGSTQLSAFEEVGQRLSRTSAACGFRWNSTIRKKYESAIHLAKKQRTKLKGVKTSLESESKLEDSLKPKNVRVFTSKKEDGNEESIHDEKAVQVHSFKEKTSAEALDLTMSHVIEFLQLYELKAKEQVEQGDYQRLLEENQRLREHLAKVEEEKKMMKDDYRSLLSIMDRARKLSL